MSEFIYEKDGNIIFDVAKLYEKNKKPRPPANVIYSVTKDKEVYESTGRVVSLSYGKNAPINLFSIASDFLYKKGENFDPSKSKIKSERQREYLARKQTESFAKNWWACAWRQILPLLDEDTLKLCRKYSWDAPLYNICRRNPKFKQLLETCPSVALEIYNIFCTNSLLKNNFYTVEFNIFVGDCLDLPLPRLIKKIAGYYETCTSIKAIDGNAPNPRTLDDIIPEYHLSPSEIAFVRNVDPVMTTGWANANAIMNLKVGWESALGPFAARNALTEFRLYDDIPVDYIKRLKKRSHWKLALASYRASAVHPNVTRTIFRDPEDTLKSLRKYLRDRNINSNKLGRWRLVFSDISDYATAVGGTIPEMRFETLLERSHAWHVDHGRARIGLSEDEDLAAIKDLPFPEPLVEDQSIGELSLVYLRNGAQLSEESNKMGHCVRSYTRKCLDKGCQIYSVRNKSKHVATVELSYNKKIVQARGPKNSDISGEVRTFLKKVFGDDAFVRTTGYFDIRPMEVGPVQGVHGIERINPFD